MTQNTQTFAEQNLNDAAHVTRDSVQKTTDQFSKGIEQSVAFQTSVMKNWSDLSEKLAKSAEEANRTSVSLGQDIITEQTTLAKQLTATTDFQSAFATWTSFVQDAADKTIALNAQVAKQFYDDVTTSFVPVQFAKATQAS